MKKLLICISFILMSLSKGKGQQQQFCDCPYPIIFVHGINSSDETWEKPINVLEEYFGNSQVISFNLNFNPNSSLYSDDVRWVTPQEQVSNKCLYVINFNNQAGSCTQSASNESGIVKQGFALKLAITEVLNKTDKEKVILVGHSMGGLASRDYLQRWETSSPSKVAKLFTMGTPHLGANIAQAAPLCGPTEYVSDPKSEASRDLAESVEIGLVQRETVGGYYLFGGDEAQTQLVTGRPFAFYDQDVNCNGVIDNNFTILGINLGTKDNPLMPLPIDVKYTYYVSNLTTIPGGDGVVDDMSQWLYKDGVSNGNGDVYDYLNGRSIPLPWDGVNHRSSDRINGTRSHFSIPLLGEGETEDYKKIIRGIDEGDFPFYASEITLSKTYIGLSQRRADLTAPNSNILIEGARGNDDPAVDGDWYRFTNFSSTSTSNILSIAKPKEKYMKVDFFSTAPSNYDNIENGSTSKISLPSDEQLILLNIGVLQPNQTYYFRITTTPGRSDENYFPYYLHIDPIANTTVIDFSPKHKPKLESPFKAGLMRFVQNGEPEFIQSEDAWKINVKAYNGYFTRFNVFKTSYPNCGITGEPIDIVRERKADFASIFKTINAYTESYKYFDSYSQNISFKVKFNENTGVYLSFPENTNAEVIQTVMFPFFEPLLASAVETLLSGSEVLGVRKKEVIHNVGTTFYQNMLKIKTLPGFSSLPRSFSPRNAVDLAEFITSEGVGFITDQILDAFRVNLQNSPEFTSLNPQWENLLVTIISDYATHKLGSGSFAIDIASAVLEASLGGFDLNNNQGLKYCLPIEFEDNRPTVNLNSPVNGYNSLTGTTNLEWAGVDPDNDLLIYDIFVKAPGTTDFVKVASDLNTSNFSYTSSANGSYEWYIKAKYPFNPLIYTISNIGHFTKNCTNNSFSINAANFELGINNDENLYDLSLTFSGNFNNTNTYKIEYLIGETKHNLSNFQISSSSISGLINGLDKSKDVSFIISDGCKTHLEVFKPYPRISYAVQSDFCLIHYKLSSLSSNPHTVKINGSSVNLNNVNDTYTQYVEKAGLFNVDIEYTLSNSAVKYRIIQSETCPTENFACPDLDIDYTFLEGDKIGITINAPDNNRFYFWKNNSGESYLLKPSASNNNLISSNQDVLPFFALGSPKSSLSVEATSSPVSCQNQDIVDEFLELAFFFLSPEMREALGVIKKAKECNWVPPILMPNNNFRPAFLPSNNDLPGKLRNHLDDFFYYDLYRRSKLSKNLEIFGSLANRDNFPELFSLTSNAIDSFIRFSTLDSVKIVTELLEFDYSLDELNFFINRWNQSLQCWQYGFDTPNFICPDIILKSNILFHDSLILLSKQHASSMNLSIDSLKEYAISSITNYSLEKDPTINPVCASVGISLSQKLTMTREAFEGTLKIFNGATTGAMDSIALHLEIKNESGVLSNHLFEIDNTSLTALTGISGTGQLAANTEGIAKILFIPEKDAAPTIPRYYSFGGSISYKDPFSSLMVTMPLVPVTLQVNPSPDLFLHYFMQRDILGDDAFTADVEPSIPARLGVMIENAGYGTAQNVRIQSAQPQVIDNEKGLALQMNLIGSKLQGGATNWGLNNIDFGSIPPLSTRVGEWLFTSNLLGHFTGYSTNVRHVSSRGNPDLSLISGAQLHELIHSIKIYGAQDDGILDFLTNEVQDANDHPDAIFASQGNTVYNVKEASTGQFLNAIQFPTFTTTLQVTPQDSGWFYLKLNDPGQGKYNIVSVTRNSDGQVIPLENAWLTYVTIPDTKIQKYEDKFHLVDAVPNNTTRTYTVVWSPKDPNPPIVDTILNVPQTIVSVPHTLLRVKFNKPIEDSTFTVADLNLTRQGGANLINNTVSITKLDSVTYAVAMDGLTDLSGYYVFTAQAAGVTDKTGVPGTTGKSVSWIQNLAGPVVVSFEGIVNNATYQQIDTVLITFNLPIDTSFLSPASFRWMKNYVYQGDTLGVSLADNTFRKFRIVGLAALTDSDVLYRIVVNLGAIKTTTGITGQDSQFVQFTIDQTGPIITSLNLITESALDNQHKTGALVSFDQVINGLVPDAFTLLLNGSIMEDSLIIIQQISPTSYKLFWGAESFGEGVYKCMVSADNLFDQFGNVGQGSDSILWVVNRTTNLAIENIYIVPDLGYSSTDKVTSNRDITLHYTYTENAHHVKIKYLVNGIESTLISKPTASNGVQSDIITLPVVGNIALKIEARDTFGNYIDTIIPVYIDELDLTGSWLAQQNVVYFTHPDSILFDFKEAVLDTGPVPSANFPLYRNNVAISNLSLNFVRLNDTLYRLEGTNSISNIPGKYRADLQLATFSKYLTGRNGAGIVSFHWEIFDPNLSPVANAGPDQIIKDLGTVYLNGSGSYDPDNNNMRYKWISLNSAQLSNDTLVSPTFLVNESHLGKMLSFLLIVSDSSKSSSDLVRIFVELDDILVKTKVLLQGSYVAAQQMMHDSLRSKSLIPLQTPYTDTNSYVFGNDNKIIAPAILQSTGENAIVDWVYVELRNIDLDSSITGGSYLIQRDGDIVETDGFSTVIFNDVPKGNYQLTIYHRNHLPIRTSENVVIVQNEIKTVDLTQDVLKIKGSINAVKLINGRYVMIAGDINNNGQIQQSDLNLCLPKVGLSGYRIEDADLNGQVQNSDIQNLIIPNLGRGKQF